MEMQINLIEKYKPNKVKLTWKLIKNKNPKKRNYKTSTNIKKHAHTHKTNISCIKMCDKILTINIMN